MSYFSLQDPKVRFQWESPISRQKYQTHFFVLISQWINFQNLISNMYMDSDIVLNLCLFSMEAAYVTHCLSSAPLVS